QRAHEEKEVGEEAEADEDRLDPEVPVADGVPEAVAERLGRALPGDVAAEEQLDQEDDRDQERDDERRTEDGVPEPRAPPVEDVLLAQPGVVGGEQARPRDEPAEDQVEQAPEREDRPGGGDDRPAEAEAGVRPEIEEGR